MKTPTHQDVTQRAYHIWEEYGRPEGRETEIWLKAEQQLTAECCGSISDSEDQKSERTVGESKGASALATRVKEETAAESAVEYLISPPISQDAAIKAALQKKEARAPQHAVKSAPHSSPAETGKPLWSQPHSS